MAINLKTKQDKTPCGGNLQSLIDVTKMSASVKFNDIKECDLCLTCPFRNICPVELTNNFKYIAVTAFTGMSIGAFPIVRETKVFVEIETKSGQVLRFDRISGVQTNCSNSRFANRVSPDEIPPLATNRPTSPPSKAN